MDSESLDYVSSVDPYQAEQNKPSVDAADEKTLVGLMRMVDKEVKLFHTISGVKRFSKELSLEQRFELCDQYVTFLTSFKQKIITAIDGIKEAGK
ncbi:MAG TPA: hypothetical protein VMR28_01200 [Candidatus Saccharimonadales bacterium]|nr:hypothetical protein [Candidatus Saccharimonadales bacterium]